jgi:hypothetical protein
MIVSSKGGFPEFRVLRLGQKRETMKGTMRIPVDGEVELPGSKTELAEEPDYSTAHMIEGKV